MKREEFINFLKSNGFYNSDSQTNPSKRIKEIKSFSNNRIVINIISYKNKCIVDISNKYLDITTDVKNICYSSSNAFAIRKGKVDITIWFEEK